jgi:hypothetical protein
MVLRPADRHSLWAHNVGAPANRAAKTAAFRRVLIHLNGYMNQNVSVLELSHKWE